MMLHIFFDHSYALSPFWNTSSKKEESEKPEKLKYRILSFVTPTKTAKFPIFSSSSVISDGVFTYPALLKYSATRPFATPNAWLMPLGPEAPAIPNVFSMIVTVFSAWNSSTANRSEYVSGEAVSCASKISSSVIPAFFILR